jgi:RND family efflux transporter MFP subunit
MTRVGALCLILVLGGMFVPPRAAYAADLDCLIQPSELVAVASPVQGVIEKLRVDRGDFVAQGAVIAELESSTERAAVEVARYKTEVESPTKSNQVRFDFGVRRFDRTDEMYKKQLVPLKELDEAETAKLLAEIGLLETQENLRLARLELERAKAALGLRTIHSPVKGVVVERILSPGEFVGQNPIMKIARIDPLRVEVFAPVALLGRVTVGMRAQVVPEAPAGTPRTASVTIVDKVVDAASGTFGVRLELPNPSYHLAAGLKCKVRFPIEDNRR